MGSTDASKPKTGKVGLTVGWQLAAGALSGLLSLRRQLGSDVSDPKVREALLNKADEALPLLALFASWKKGEGYGSRKVGELLDGVVGKFFAGRTDLTVGEAIQFLEDKGDHRGKIVKLLDELSAGGKVTSVADVLGGVCITIGVPGPGGLQVPVVIAVGTPFTWRKEWLGRVSQKFQRDMGPLGRMKPWSQLEAARALPGWVAGRDDRAIADDLYEEEHYRDAIKAEMENEKGRPLTEKEEEEVDRRVEAAIVKRAYRLQKLRERYVAALKKVMRPSSKE